MNFKEKIESNLEIINNNYDLLRRGFDFPLLKKIKKIKG